jgi:IMP dehydrogenase
MKSSSQSLDESFYLSADAFFTNIAPMALTYDDVSLATLYSEILPKQTSLETILSDSLRLHIPIISSDMDTVTESDMAIAMALHGGMGLIHYNMSNENQIKEVQRVKYAIHGLIQDPITVHPEQTIAEVLDLVESKHYGFRTFPVVDKNNTLLGLLPGHVVKERYKSRKVIESMTPRENVFTIHEREIAKNPIQVADKFFTEHIGIHKLLVIDNKFQLRGLFTLSDIERINEEAKAMIKPARDSRFRLVCGVAISAPRSSSGSLEKNALIEHVGRLVDAGADAIAISSAHGFSAGMGEVVKALRSTFKELNIIAGNVTSAAGVEFLADQGANIIKIGQGPGSICTTRIVAGVGIPQMTALYVASKAAANKGVKIIADGGITKSGDIVKALTLADAVICGNLLAGCQEAPGGIMEINGKWYKQYRGMGSMQAMKAGSAARYGHTQKESLIKAAAEGIEALKEISGSAHTVLRELLGGVQSGLGYLGAKDFNELKQKARYVRVSPAGQKESSPHDVVEVKSTPNNHSQK